MGTIFNAAGPLQLVVTGLAEVDARVVVSVTPRTMPRREAELALRFTRCKPWHRSGGRLGPPPSSRP